MRRVLVLFLLMIFCLKSNALVVLQYHHVSNKTPESTSIHPDLFKAHMQYIEERKFNVLSAKDLKKILLNKKTPPNHSVVITFDDGYKSVYDIAFPELKKRKWPFVVFVNSKSHDEKNENYMSWKQLKAMSKYGATIANHTDSHPHLIRNWNRQSDFQWNNERVREVEFAEKRIKKEIGKSEKLFAYPYGEYDKNLQKILTEKGYLAFGQQSGPVVKMNSRIPIPRFPFAGAYGGMEDFETKINSLPFPSVSVQVADENGRPFSNPELPHNVERPVLKFSSPIFQVMKGVNCYASGQGLIESKQKGGAVYAQAKRPLPVGRSRYNCTMSAGGGRFYWYSQMFIRRQQDGSWYRE